MSNLPGVDTILADAAIKPLIHKYSHQLVSFIVKDVLKKLRTDVIEMGQVPAKDEILNIVKSRVATITVKSLKPVINATGVIIHTNLGRAPFGKGLLNDANEVLSGYNNLEFDLEKAGRGSRYVHVTELLKYLTGAEDILVVNNNAAAIMLVLRTFARDREVVISRGELIEIGGSFRMPDIMKASDCIMVEVGTTNKTKILDFENAINESTALLLKVHQSNYVIKGFTKEATLTELVGLSKKTGIPVVWDMGSGLLRKPSLKILKDEPDVSTALKTGVDILTFSGDKLLGGPQAGIIAGKAEFIEKLKNQPMTRALRVGKETVALLESLCIKYLDEDTFFKYSPIYKMMTSSPESLKTKAEELQKRLQYSGLDAEIVNSSGQTGGGSMPEETIDSYAVQLSLIKGSRKDKTLFAEKTYRRLLIGERPLLGILRKGKLVFDVLTLDETQIDAAANLILGVCKEVLPHG